MIALPDPVYCPRCRELVAPRGSRPDRAVFTCQRCPLNFRVSLAQLAAAGPDSHYLEDSPVSP